MKEFAKEKIVIIGGGAAGAKIAAKAKRECPQNEIELYTEEKFIAYSACGLPYFIEGIVDDIKKLIIRTPEDFLKQGIKVFLEHQAQKIYPERNEVLINSKIVKYDKLAICTGAVPIVLEAIKNRDIFGVYYLRKIQDAIKIKQEIKNAETAVIIGGGFIGLELLEGFVHNGIATTILEYGSKLMGVFDEEFSEDIKEYILNKDGQYVNLFFNDSVVEFFEDKTGKFYKLKTKSGKEIEADFCVIASGVVPNVELAANCGIELGVTGGIVVDDTLKTNIENIWAAGDCTQNKCIITNSPAYFSLGNIANKEGRVAAINMSHCEVKERFSGILGSAITKYFNYTLALVGINEHKAKKMAKKLNIEPIAVTVIKKDKAGYIPNSRNITIKIVADKKTGRLLGAQGVGEGDVARRINTMTSAIQSGLTVEDFLHLDLPYSPTNSSTIDILLIAMYELKKKM